jgi:hypothetical protein
MSEAYFEQVVVDPKILRKTDMRGLIEHQLIPIELWLAQKISEWRKRYFGD